MTGRRQCRSTTAAQRYGYSRCDAIDSVLRCRTGRNLQSVLGAGDRCEKSLGSWGRGRPVPMRTPRELRSATRGVGRAEWRGTDHNRQHRSSPIGQIALFLLHIVKKAWGFQHIRGNRGLLPRAVLPRRGDRAQRVGGTSTAELVRIGDVQPASHRRGSLHLRTILFVRLFCQFNSVGPGDVW